MPPAFIKANAPHAEAFGAKLPAQARDQMEQEDKMLSIRTRGKNGIYYIRGTVTLGDKHIDVKEFSSGTSDRDAASHLMAEHETKLRHRLMFGPAAIVAQGKIADAFESYLTKAKPPCPSDILRIGKLNGLIGDFSLREPKQAWKHFRRAYLTGHDPAGQDRYRADEHDAHGPPGNRACPDRDPVELFILLSEKRSSACHRSASLFSANNKKHLRMFKQPGS